MAFVSSLGSEGLDESSESDDQSEGNDDDREEESLQESYNRLYEESLRINKVNVKVVSKLKKE